MMLPTIGVMTACPRTTALSDADAMPALLSLSRPVVFDAEAPPPVTTVAVADLSADASIPDEDDDVAPPAPALDALTVALAAPVDVTALVVAASLAASSLSLLTLSPTVAAIDDAAPRCHRSKERRETAATGAPPPARTPARAAHRRQRGAPRPPRARSLPSPPRRRHHERLRHLEPLPLAPAASRS